MIIPIEIEFDIDVHEYDDGRVAIEAIRFPGCTQNLMQFMAIHEQDQAQQAVEDAHEKAAIEKVERLLEKKAMRADIAREFQQETLRELQLQRGVR